MAMHRFPLLNLEVSRQKRLKRDVIFVGQKMQKVVVEIISVTYAKHRVYFYYIILHVSISDSSICCQNLNS